MTFIRFIKFVFLLFGFDVDKKFSSKSMMPSMLKVWKIMMPIIITVGSVQLWISFFLLSNDDTIMQTAAITMNLLFSFKSFAGYSTVAATNKSSLKLLQKIENVHRKITENCIKVEDEKVVKNAYGFGIKIFTIISSMCILNVISSFIKIFLALWTDTVPENLSIICLWLPSFLTNSWSFVTSYSSVILILFSWSNLTAPELIYITSAYLSASFERLGVKIQEVIDGTENRSFLESKRKFAECVDLHSELIDLANESNKLYGPFNLAFLVLVSVGICVLGILIMVSQLS